MDWRELKQHCKLHKQGKLLNTHRPMQKKSYQPAWQKIKSYGSNPTLEQNIGLRGKNTDDLITQLKVGGKIRLMN